MTNMPIITIKLRTKFAKLIENDYTRQAYIIACEKFCGLAEDAASAILWRLTYSTDAATEDLRRLGLNLEEIPQEILNPLKNELHSQYKQHNPNAWEVAVPDECVEAFTDLKNHAGEIVAEKVWKHCDRRVSTNEEDMNRLLFLLKSDMENRYFGGLRELDFNYEQASYLKPFHMLVHNLFVTVYEQFKHQSHSGVTFTNKPFEGLAERLDKAGISLSNDDLPFEDNITISRDKAMEVQHEPAVEKPTEDVAEVPEQIETTKFTALTVENILANKEVFSAFANANDFGSLSQIKNLGFDLNAVISHVDAISQILQWTELLEEAQNNLDKAAKALYN